MTLRAKLEALLFVASRPLSLKKLSEFVGSDITSVSTALDELGGEYAAAERGFQLQRQSSEVQLVTHPEASKIVADFLKAERTGELSRPSLETLTIIAYRSPITKSELDLIRGVNCSLILRNLMVRGLVSAEDDHAAGVMRYSVTFDFLRHLGVRAASELPDFERLNANEFIDRLLHPEIPSQNPTAVESQGSE